MPFVESDGAYRDQRGHRHPDPARLSRIVDDFDWRVIPLGIVAVGAFWGVYYLGACVITAIRTATFG